MHDAELGREQEVRDREDRAARVAVERAVGAELLQVPGRSDARLLGELAARRPGEPLARQHEPAGERERAAVRLDAALDEEHVQRVVAHGERDDVDRDGQEGRAGRDVGGRCGGCGHGPIVAHSCQVDENLHSGLRSLSSG